MWFSICAGGDIRLGAADLSSMGMGMIGGAAVQVQVLSLSTWAPVGSASRGFSAL
jgi:hypothetical protein